jgi:sterol desaturase/sphingolipid hydroxylase (fatty acid hydroxylase superfamily)
MRAIVGVLVGFAVLFVAFRLLDFLRPPERRLPVRRRGFATDLAWFAFTPLVTRSVTRFGVGLALLPAAILIYGRFDPDLIQKGYGPAAQLPLWLQAFLILFIGDFFGYWMHRFFHGRRLWAFHAVHHSSVDLDWLSAVRVHPVNDLVMKIVGALPLVAAGFSPLAVAAIVPVLTIYAIAVHANVDWDFGPLRAIVVSPRFHRWHHTNEAHARDKNFAGLFPVFDILFGTYHMPKGEVPRAFGTDTPVPSGIIGQLAFPFRRAKQ